MWRFMSNLLSWRDVRIGSGIIGMTDVLDSLRESTQFSKRQVNCRYLLETSVTN